MTSEAIKELCETLNPAQTELGDQVNVFGVAADTFDLNERQADTLELACTLQRFDEVVQQYSGATDSVLGRAEQIMEALESGDIPLDKAGAAMSSIMCEAKILTGHEQTPEEVSQCIQDIRQTNAALSR